MGRNGTERREKKYYQASDLTPYSWETAPSSSKHLGRAKGRDALWKRSIKSSNDPKSYSSWERGINENTNGLLRQFFPKQTDFRKISWQQVTEAVDLLNNRPEKHEGIEPPTNSSTITSSRLWRNNCTCYLNSSPHPQAPRSSQRKGCLVGKKYKVKQ